MSKIQKIFKASLFVLLLFLGIIFVPKSQAITMCQLFGISCPDTLLTIYCTCANPENNYTYESYTDDGCDGCGNVGHGSCGEPDPRTGDCSAGYYLAGSCCVAGCVSSCDSWTACSAPCGMGTQSQDCIDSDCSVYTNTQACNTQQCVAVSASISQSAVSTAIGAAVTISWNSTDAASCSVTKSVNGGTASAWANGTSGSQTENLVIVGTHVFTNTCTGTSGSLASNSVTHTVTAASCSSNGCEATTCDNATCDNGCSSIAPGTKKCCTGINAGSACPGAETGLSVSTPWSSVLFGDESNCSPAVKCQYYTCDSALHSCDDPCEGKCGNYQKKCTTNCGLPCSVNTCEMQDCGDCNSGNWIEI